MTDIEILLKDFEEQLKSFKTRDEICKYLASKGIFVIDKTTGIEYGKKTDIENFQEEVDKYIDNLTPEEARASLINRNIVDENGEYPLIDPADENIRSFLKGFGILEEDIDLLIEESNKRTKDINKGIQRTRK